MATLTGRHASTHAVAEPDAAHYIGYTQSALRKWRCEGRGPAYVRAGRSVRYRISDLDRWLETHRVEPDASPAARVTPRDVDIDAAAPLLDEFGEAWYAFFQRRDVTETDEDDGPTLSDLVELLIMLREFAECLPRTRRQRLGAVVAQLTA